MWNHFILLLVRCLHHTKQQQLCHGLPFTKADHWPLYDTRSNSGLAGVIFNSCASLERKPFNSNWRLLQFYVSQMLPQLDPGAQFCRLQFIMSGRFANFLLISPNRPLARSLGKFAGEKICKLGKVSIRTRHTQLNLVCILANPEISHKSLQFISNGWRRRPMLAF